MIEYDNRIIDMCYRKMTNILLNFDTKMTLSDVRKLKVDNIENCINDKFNDRIGALGFNTKTFLKNFKADCNIYMLQGDTITINSYLNFLETVKNK